MAFLEAPQSEAEVEAVPKLVRGPCLLNMVAGGKTPMLDLDTAARLGFRLTILPGLLFSVAVAAFDAALATVRSERRQPARQGSPKDLFRRMGADHWDGIREAFRAPDPGEPARQDKSAAE
jgi:2-methylisocitrate lyase-like PEP mutase family enzyme